MGSNRFVFRALRSPLALSTVAISLFASFAFRFWPEPLLRNTLQRLLPAGFCLDPACNADDLALRVLCITAIAISNLVLAATFLYLSGSLGKRLPSKFRLGAFVLAISIGCSAVFAAMWLYSLWQPDSALTAGVAAVTALLAMLLAGMTPSLVRAGRRILREVESSKRMEIHLLAAMESSLDAFYMLRSTRGEDGQIHDFQFTYANRNGERLMGLSRDTIRGTLLCSLSPIYRTCGFFERYKNVVMNGEPYVHEFPVQFQDGVPRWIRHQVVRLEDGIAITASDITERKQSEQRAMYRANHDTLTGLPNRALLDDRIHQAMERANRYQHKVALFVVDLDGFKRINDTLGHTAGDLALIMVAQRLSEATRATDSVLRIGGDEFIVVMPDLLYESDVQRAGEKLLEAILREGPAGLETVRVSCSVGAAIYPTIARSAQELLLRADAAMYQAKMRGGGAYELFSEQTTGFYPVTGLANLRPRTQGPALVTSRPSVSPPA